MALINLGEYFEVFSSLAWRLFKDSASEARTYPWVFLEVRNALAMTLMNQKEKCGDEGGEGIWCAVTKTVSVY